jgi:hypothetical protein
VALNPEQLNVMRGHPTAPGIRDKRKIRRGLPTTADGVPGLPRLYMDRHSHGPGIPGGTSGPIQPGVIYDNPAGVDDGGTTNARPTAEPDGSLDYYSG